MRTLVLLSGLILATSLQAADVPPPSGDTIVDSSAKLELLYERTADIAGGLTEGAAVAPDGSIYFSDIPIGEDHGLIVRFDPKTKKTSVFTDNSHKSNGLMFNQEGDLIAVEGSDFGGRCVSRWDVKTKTREVVADKYMGKKFNAPNDLDIDAQGRIYFTDPKYLGAEERELKYRAVYRVEKDGSVTEVTHNLSKPNGIGLSLDEKTLFVANHDNGTDRITPDGPAPKQGKMAIYAFPLNEDGLVGGKRKTLYDFGKMKGCDGMTLDENGNVYLTVRDPSRPGVLVVTPDEGKEIAFIPTGASQPGSKSPVGLPSNCCFGIGDEANVLYVTIDTSLYRIPLKVKGAAPAFQK